MSVHYQRLFKTVMQKYKRGETPKVLQVHILQRFIPKQKLNEIMADYKKNCVSVKKRNTYSIENWEISLAEDYVLGLSETDLVMKYKEVGGSKNKALNTYRKVAQYFFKKTVKAMQNTPDTEKEQ